MESIEKKIHGYRQIDGNWDGFSQKRSRILRKRIERGQRKTVRQYVKKLVKELEG
jgi:hypothetical protein